LPAEISAALRKRVAERAGYRCEYCLLHEDDANSPHQVDHIVSRKHGGASTEDNLAWCCMRCNLWKGADIGSFSTRTRYLVPLFDPRKDRWADHFRLDGAIIEPLTPQGEVTTRLLRLNLDKRVIERTVLIMIGRYPIT
jgi:hypothetical protein